jgi:hypothetical protein
MYWRQDVVADRQYQMKNIALKVSKGSVYV